jgi:hypothetical protein
MAPDARLHQTSLNNNQAIPDANGSVTYVVSLTDPGIANWIDPGGHPEGWFMLRWQDFPDDANLDDLVTGVSRVPLALLDGFLRDRVARITPEQRSLSIARRAQDFQHRVGQA